MDSHISYLRCMNRILSVLPSPAQRGKHLDSKEVAMDEHPRKGNVKNPAIRRIHADIRELQKDPSDQYHAAPLEENLFEWHFTLRGPPATDYDGGVYHGRILLPAEYPFKPPNIMLLTPSGRFEIGKKICLSISAHHPEHWQPAWGGLILEALISFFPTEPKGAVGSLDWTPEERKRLAVESQSWCCARCGLIKTLLPPLNTVFGEESGKEGEEGEEEGADGAENNGGKRTYAEAVSQLYVRAASESAASQEEALGEDKEDGGQKDGGVKPYPTLKHESGGSSASPSVPTPAEPNLRQQAAAPTSITSSSLARQRSAGTRSSSINSAAVAFVEENEGEEEKEDKLFYLAVFLFLLLILLVGRKLARAWIRQRGVYLEEGISASGWEDGIDL
ncbi:ubiquitin-conjugating enzyme e2 j1 [Nannochloropsis gaditana]|uniref:Ubiquitin-conjugating enzyme e2 j1 n=1 Tax=Nannochloropsis gaditana TaxID=72520 RepID=W7TWN5_9STRA|nr:ubiquitin-conjugating enzyme e2 j1 [Nannochloropsis gaditana]